MGEKVRGAGFNTLLFFRASTRRLRCVYLKQQSDVSLFSGWILFQSSPEIGAVLRSYEGGAKDTRDLTVCTSVTLACVID